MSHVVLVCAVTLAACGGAAGTAPAPQVAPSPSGSESVPAPGAGVPGAPGNAAAPGASTSALEPGSPLSPSTAPVEMKSPMPSAMVDDLRALGLDAKSLPPIEKLEPRTLRGVMKLMAKSLGLRCGDCHQEGDFAAPTRRKKIAAHMWDEFAAKMTLGASSAPDAAPLFCDSCHQGRVQLLDRRDKKALSHWMDDNFVTKLDRKDGKDIECETCHVDMDMHFLAKWGSN